MGGMGGRRGRRPASFPALGEVRSCLFYLSLCFCVSPRLMGLKLDPSILPPTPRCLGAREASTLGGAAAEAPDHTSSCSCSSCPLHPSLYVSTELSRPANSLLTSPPSLPLSLHSSFHSFPHPSPSLCSSSTSFPSLLTFPELLQVLQPEDSTVSPTAVPHTVSSSLPRF